MEEYGVKLTYLILEVHVFFYLLNRMRLGRLGRCIALLSARFSLDYLNIDTITVDKIQCKLTV